MPRYRITIEYDGTPFPAGNARPTVRRAGRPRGGAACASPARRVTCAAPGAPTPACMRWARWRISIWQGMGAVSRARGDELSFAPCAGRGPRLRAGRGRFRRALLRHRAPLPVPHPDAARAAGARTQSRVVAPFALDAGAMHEAAQALVGHHDFTTFRAAHARRTRRCARSTGSR